MALLTTITAAITANGDYDAILQESGLDISINGTFGTAQVDILKVNPIDDSLTTALAAGVAITADFAQVYTGAKGTKVRFVVSGVGGGTSLRIATLPLNG